MVKCLQCVLPQQSVGWCQWYKLQMFPVGGNQEHTLSLDTPRISVKSIIIIRSFSTENNYVELWLQIIVQGP